MREPSRIAPFSVAIAIALARIRRALAHSAQALIDPERKWVQGPDQLTRFAVEKRFPNLAISCLR